MVINTKIGYGVTGNGQNTVVLSYRLFFDWVEKSGNFLNFLHGSSGLFRTVYLG
jgi:hypothetical protein